MSPEPASSRSDRSPYSRVGSAAAWEEAAAPIARGERLKEVADRLGCSRSTLWRTLQRSERLRTRIAEERRYLSEEASLRFRSLHRVALDAIEAALHRGDLRAAIWVADKLGIARPRLHGPGAGLRSAQIGAEAGIGPAVDMALFTLDSPLHLEPDLAAELKAAALAANRAPATPPPAALPPIGVRTPEKPPKKLPENPSDISSGASATRPQKRCRTLHTVSDLALTQMLEKAPQTAAAWPAGLLPPVPSLSPSLSMDRKGGAARQTPGRAGR